QLCCLWNPPVIVASGIAVQFGAKPPFFDVSVKFGAGNRYGLLCSNGCGKSTFMKILGGGAGAERGVGGYRIQLKEPGQKPTHAVVAAVQLSSVGDHGSRTFAGSWTVAFDRYPGT